eukprot:TRINITY_DN3866_c0_g1_i2.p1 TRINITY_DN3866_c0_g1~~TRINITY_DN3866_c0_g1_i2.p1  ORF type:complete len:166 (+),score=22.67 TRINITY_DN3866_c0_g1_i2:122-619(+)
MDATEDSTLAGARVRLLRRISESWYIFAFGIYGLLVASCFHLKCNVNFRGVIIGINIAFVFYLIFFAASLIQCLKKNLEFIFKVIEFGFFGLFLFVLFVYAQWLYLTPNNCQRRAPHLNVYILIFLLLWYSLFLCKLVALIIFFIRKKRAQQAHDLEGWAIFMDL